MPPSARKRIEHVPELAARLRIEARRRLVEKQQIRIADERAGHREALLLAARELADPAASRLLFELDEREQLVDGRARGGRTIGTAAASPRR